MRSISQIGTSVFISAILCLQLAWAPHIPAQIPSTLRLQGGNLLVLKNGEILRGGISQSPEKVVVQTDQGSKLVIQSEQVDFICNSVDEAYWEKCARTKASDVEGQKNLFSWCLKQKLLNQAQNQIDLLTQTKIKARELESLDRQLNAAIRRYQSAATKAEIASSKSNSRLLPDSRETGPAFLQPLQAIENTSSKRHIPPAVKQTIGVPKLDLAEIDSTIFHSLPSLAPSPLVPMVTSIQRQPIDNSFKPMNSSTPPMPEATVDNFVQQVGFEQPIEETFDPAKLKVAIDDQGRPVVSKTAGPKVTSPRNELENISPQTINAHLDELPKDFVGFYRKRVAKLFTNGCKAAKCHEMSDTVMPLMHRSRSLPIPEGMSKRNLYYISQYIDFANPLSSPMLTAATEPHAGNALPVFKPGSSQRKQLARWLGMLGPGTGQPITDDRGTLIPTKNAGSKPSTEDLPEIQPVKPAPAGSPPLGAAKLSTTIGEIPDLGKQEKKYIPIDPFDPEIFNRKHRK